MEFTPVPNGRMFGVAVKHPLAVIVVYVDWSAFVDALQTTVLSSEWVDPLLSPLVLGDPMFTNNIASVEIGGGEANRAHIIENRLDFADGGRAVFRLSVYLSN